MAVRQVGNRPRTTTPSSCSFTSLSRKLINRNHSEPRERSKLIRPRPRLGGLAVACSLLADPGRRPCAIFLTSHSSATRHQWLNLFSTRHECFTSDVGLTRTRLVSCILLTSLFNVGGQTGKDCLLTWADGVKVTDRRDRTRNLSLRKRCTNHCTMGPPAHTG